MEHAYGSSMGFPWNFQGTTGHPPYHLHMLLAGLVSGRFRRLIYPNSIPNPNPNLCLPPGVVLGRAPVNPWNLWKFHGTLKEQFHRFHDNILHHITFMELVKILWNTHGNSMEVT